MTESDSGVEQCGPDSPECASTVGRIDVDLQITGINSTFHLSDMTDFCVLLDRFAVPGVGEFIDANEREVTIEFYSYHGRCVVQRNGLVKCSGQLSFDEALAVSAKVVLKFRRCGQAVGIHRHGFHIVTAKAELPFCVSLNQMKRKDPGILYLPEVMPPSATLIPKGVNLNSTIQLYATGKLTVFSSGDCVSRDSSMPNLCQAIEMVASTARDCMVPGSEKKAGYGSRPSSLSPVEKLLEKNRHFYKPRRSRRISQMTLAEQTLTEHRLKRDSPDGLSERHKRLFQLLDFFTDIWSCRTLTVILKDLISDRSVPKDTAEALAVVGRFFGSTKRSTDDMDTKTVKVARRSRHGSESDQSDTS